MLSLLTFQHYILQMQSPTQKAVIYFIPTFLFTSSHLLLIKQHRHFGWQLNPDFCQYRNLLQSPARAYLFPFRFRRALPVMAAHCCSLRHPNEPQFGCRSPSLSQISLQLKKKTFEALSTYTPKSNPLDIAPQGLRYGTGYGASCLTSLKLLQSSPMGQLLYGCALQLTIRTAL